MRPRATLSTSVRLFPATLTDAVALFPDVVLSLAYGDLKVTAGGSSEGRQVMLLENEKRAISLAVLRTDYDIIAEIAEAISTTAIGGFNGGRSVSIFLGEPRQASFERAQAMIRVRFANRGAF